MQLWALQACPAGPHASRTAANCHPPLQVALNQLCLAPLTISVAFAWNLVLTGKADQLPAKLRADFLRTMLNGWRFWVPAATVNFVAVPLKYQVLGQRPLGLLGVGGCCRRVLALLLRAPASACPPATNP